MKREEGEETEEDGVAGTVGVGHQTRQSNARAHVETTVAPQTWKDCAVQN